jgi:hypothetical protein
MAKKKEDTVPFQWHEAQMKLGKENQQADINFYLKRVSELENEVICLKAQNRALYGKQIKFVEEKEALISAVDALSFVLTSDEQERTGK